MHGSRAVKFHKIYLNDRDYGSIVRVKYVKMEAQAAISLDVLSGCP
jgi:hypothetical protein